MEFLHLSSSWLAKVHVGSIRLNGWALVDLDIWAELELFHFFVIRALESPYVLFGIPPRFPVLQIANEEVLVISSVVPKHLTDVAGREDSLGEDKS